MEAAVEQLPDHSSTDNLKISEVEYQTSVQDDLNPKSNGISESDNVVQSELDNVNLPTGKIDANGDTTGAELVAEDAVSTECNIDPKESLVKKLTSNDGESNVVAADTASTEVASVDAAIVENQDDVNNTSNINQNQLETSLVTEIMDIENKTSESNNVETEEVALDAPIPEPVGADNVRFETEVVVETNDVETTEVEPSNKKTQDTQNILNEMNQNIELSEVLRSSDVTDNVENNNCSIRQEVFNKEELLDILEGNDVQSEQQVIDGAPIANNQLMETELALKQLTRLKKTRKPRSTFDTSLAAERQTTKKKTKVKKVVEPEPEPEPEPAKEESIVNSLVKDWEDDPEEGDSVNDKKESSEQLSESTANAIKTEKRSSVDSANSEGHTSAVNKSVDDGQPQRRLGRVIKKKVIFDPDNPDTFTKGKTVIKSKEAPTDKDQPPPKKGKLEPTEQRAKSKSPVSKMQWKKPSSKSSKQNKRLSEVDRLLMDEGAVNMIYQLTPEAPKGKKNMRTKAEFIKKLQSSTPETKEMKFRERKKEGKSEDGDAKKIPGGKHRSSLSSSVQSPSVCEDFETHSADDSIIYRRHSSSSYSSSCMSPRRLSDVEGGVHQTANITQQSNEIKSPSAVPSGDNDIEEEALKGTPAKKVIDKDDCLSIKKKLNSKLSQALNKRKRDSLKIEKPLKKQIKSNEVMPQNQLDNLKYLSIKIDQRVAEICIKNAKIKLRTEVMKEMIRALSYLDLRTDTSVTVLTSESGPICPELDLSPSLHNDHEERTKAANEIAETIRCLLWALAKHSKLTCVAAGGACVGITLALVALADVALATDTATFAAAPRPVSPPESGIAALVTSYRQLPQTLLNDLVLFGRQLSSAEALQAGLVSRVLCSAGFSAQVQAVIRDIASEPMETLLMKKKLLGLRKLPDEVFLSCLETEKSLMVKYWSSDDGQEAIRTVVLEELKL